jgi:hypothetical protein
MKIKYAKEFFFLFLCCFFIFDFAALDGCAAALEGFSVEGAQGKL